MAMLAIFGSFGLPEMLVILVLVLVLFGASRIPQLMRGFGQGISEFKKGIHEGDEPPAPPQSPEKKP